MKHNGTWSRHTILTRSGNWGHESLLGKGPKIKKRESMVFDHRGGGGGHPKPNPYSDRFL